MNRSWAVLAGEAVVSDCGKNAGHMGVLLVINFFIFCCFFIKFCVDCDTLEILPDFSDIFILLMVKWLVPAVVFLESC
jgi:hypothetical protein